MKKFLSGTTAKFAVLSMITVMGIDASQAVNVYCPEKVEIRSSGGGTERMTGFIGYTTGKKINIQTTDRHAPADEMKKSQAFIGATVDVNNPKIIYCEYVFGPNNLSEKLKGTSSASCKVVNAEKVGEPTVQDNYFKCE